MCTLFSVNAAGLVVKTVLNNIESSVKCLNPTGNPLLLYVSVQKFAPRLFVPYDFRND